MIRSKLPSKLTRNNFLVKLPELTEEDDEGLVSAEEENHAMIVELASRDCAYVKKGDDIIINRGTLMNPKVMIKTEEGSYVMYSENEVLGIW